MAHLAEFLQYGVDAAGADEQRPLGEPAGDFLRELLPREEFLRQHGVLGEHEADAAMKFRGESGTWVHGSDDVASQANIDYDPPMTMSLTLTSPASEPDASREMREYIRTHDLETALTTTLRLAETALPSGSACKLELGDDPESDETWLVVHLAINVPRSQALDRLDQFVELWIDSVPPEAQCRIHFTYSAKDQSMKAKSVDEVELLAVWLYGEAEEAGQLSVLRQLVGSSSKSAREWYGLPEGDEPDDPEDLTTIVGKFAAKWDEIDRRHKGEAAQGETGSAS